MTTLTHTNTKQTNIQGESSHDKDEIYCCYTLFVNNDPKKRPQNIIYHILCYITDDTLTNMLV